MKTKTFKVIWENVTTKDWDQPVQRTTSVDALHKNDATQLIYSRFGNQKRVHIIEVKEVIEPIPIRNIEDQPLIEGGEKN